MVAGFGPFRVTTRKTYDGGGGGGGGGRREIFPLSKRSSHLGGSGSSGGSGGSGGGGGGEPINYLRYKEKWESEKKPIDGQSGFQLSPFFQFRPPLNPSCVVHGRVEDSLHLSRENGLIVPEREENVDFAGRVRVSSNGVNGPPLLLPSFSQRRLIDVDDLPPSRRPQEQLPLGDHWHASTSAQPASQSIGAPYHSDGVNNASSQPFHDPHLVHYPMIRRQTERPSCMNQPKNLFPFGTWADLGGQIQFLLSLHPLLHPAILVGKGIQIQMTFSHQNLES
uniref:Uncharacterized protein n=1 Tax=Ananas comosus var. bracteatus TaxID=296719 RepID=A0A6V7QF80_ANACO|nr:unnamed protein product [Ananas comosus var. bracteatus]